MSKFSAKVAQKEEMTFPDFLLTTVAMGKCMKGSIMVFNQGYSILKTYERAFEGQKFVHEKLQPAAFLQMVEKTEGDENEEEQDLLTFWRSKGCEDDVYRAMAPCLEETLTCLRRLRRAMASLMVEEQNLIANIAPTEEVTANFVTKMKTESSLSTPEKVKDLQDMMKSVSLRGKK